MLSALIFTENKLLHWCFAKVTGYLPLKRLVNVLKFRISCFEVTPSKCLLPTVIANSPGKSFLLLRILFLWK